VIFIFIDEVYFSHIFFIGDQSIESPRSLDDENIDLYILDAAPSKRFCGTLSLVIKYSSNDCFAFASDTHRVSVQSR